MTKWVLAGVIVLLVGYELFALVDPADQFEMITPVIRHWNEVTGGLVAFLFGLLCGHFFWCPRRK